MIFINFLKTGESIGIDATLALSKNSTAQTTDHAIEDGQNVTDYIINDPRIYSLNGFLSNIPWKPQGGLTGFEDLSNVGDLLIDSTVALVNGGIINGVQTLLSGGLTENVPYKWNADGYHQYADDRFQQAIDNGEEVEIDANHRGIFGPVIITSYSANWDTEHGSGIPITLEFKELRKVQSENAFGQLLGGLAGAFNGGLLGAFESEDIARQFNPVTESGISATLTATTKQTDKLSDIAAVGALSTAGDFFRGA